MFQGEYPVFFYAGCDGLDGISFCRRCCGGSTAQSAVVADQKTAKKRISFAFRRPSIIVKNGFLSEFNIFSILDGSKLHEFQVSNLPAVPVYRGGIFTECRNPGLLRPATTTAATFRPVTGVFRAFGQNAGSHWGGKTSPGISRVVLF